MTPGRYTIAPLFLSDPERTKAFTREVEVLEDPQGVEGSVLIEEVVKDGQAGKLWSRGDRKRLSLRQWKVTPVDPEE